jgi:hypothetical protein
MPMVEENFIIRRHSKEDDIKEGKITPSWWAKWLLW